MHFRALNLFATFLLSIFLVGCSAGGGTTGSGLVCIGGGASGLCLVGCSLGCNLSGCAIGSVAQNQSIALNFNQPVDQRTVNSGSIVLRTSTGEEPVGSYLVSGSTVTFVPQIQIVGAQIFYGFKPNEAYRLFLPNGAGSASVVRSLTGDALDAPLSCNLIIGPILDLNALPPAATMMSPTNLVDAPVDTKIVLEFNELLDPAPFLNTTPNLAPVRFLVRTTVETSPGVFACNRAEAGVILLGTPLLEVDPVRQITVLTFTPQQTLPSRLCVEVEVSSKVRDLAGVSARPKLLSFITEDVGVQDFSQVEDFDDTLKLDMANSAGTFDSPSGSASFFQLGGEGRLGTFNFRDGLDINGDGTVFVFSTDEHKFPAKSTGLEAEETVTGGLFQFSSFQVPPGVTVRFVGANPPRLQVRGQVDIQGVLDVSSANIAKNSHQADSALGQSGGLGGPFGGRGGKGGDRADGKGVQPRFHGSHGQNMQLLQGHAYADRALSSGGRGSRLFPPTGKNGDLLFHLNSDAAAGEVPNGDRCMMASTGGSGGGGATVGGSSSVLWDRDPPPILRPYPIWNEHVANPLVGGGQFVFDQLLPPLPSGWTEEDHHMVGGAGGGGGGSHALGVTLDQLAGASSFWRSGHAGAGGGGAIGIRAGGDLRVGEEGSIQARGGSAAPTPSAPHASPYFAPNPGGGGGGGSIFLQINGNVELLGLLDSSGGAGGTLIGTGNYLQDLESQAGAGADGIVRLRSAFGTDTSLLGQVIPAAVDGDVQPLVAVDSIVGIQSLWYAVDQVIAPTFVRYVIEATVDGNPAVFSDDPNFPGATVPARGVTPLFFRIQGALVERLNGGIVSPLGNIPPWRTQVGSFDPAFSSLNDDKPTGYRFQIFLDRSLGQTVTIDKVTVNYAL